jgi:ubiquitin
MRRSTDAYQKSIDSYKKVIDQVNKEAGAAEVDPGINPGLATVRR